MTQWWECPGLTLAWCHIWVEFVVGSCLALRVFLRVLRLSSPHKNQQLQIPIQPGYIEDLHENQLKLCSFLSKYCNLFYVRASKFPTQIFHEDGLVIFFLYIWHPGIEKHLFQQNMWSARSFYEPSKDPYSASVIFYATEIIDIAWWSKICFTVSCVPESMFNIIISSSFTLISFVLTCSKWNINNSQTLAWALHVNHS